jgi:hypothetical protein
MRSGHHCRISRTWVTRISSAGGLARTGTIGMPTPSLATVIDTDLAGRMQLLLASDLFYLLTLSSTHVAVFAFQFCIFGRTDATKRLIRIGWVACAVVTAIALPIIGSAPSTVSRVLHGEQQRVTMVCRTKRRLMILVHSC